jgi:hypothetical protein
VVDLIRYSDTAGRDRQVFRLRRDGVLVGEYATPEDVAKQVNWPRWSRTTRLTRPESQRNELILGRVCHPVSWPGTAGPT